MHGVEWGKIWRLFQRITYHYSPEPSPAESQKARTSASSSRRSAELKAIPYMFLDLNGPGNLLGLLYWETLSPWRGGSWTLNTGASPNAAVVSSLSQILQDSVPEKYYLSRTACLGILRRAQERGKELPLQLKGALMAQAGLVTVPTANSGLKAYHINQRDEGIDLGEVSGALMATTNMQMQTFVTQPEQPVGFDGYNGDLTGDKAATLGVNCGMSTGRNGLIQPIAFAANQRDEVRNLHDVAGAIQAQPGMKQQTFISEGCLTPWDTQQKRIFLPDGVAPTLTGADGGGGRTPGGLLLEDGCLNPWDTQQKRIFTPDGTSPTLSGVEGGGWNPAGLLFTAAFCAGAGKKAGGIGYSEQVAPTLKGGPGGNSMPSVLCLNDQGGERMDLTIEQTMTLRAGMGSHQPLICLNDQGGSIMECTEDMTGTLRAQEHGHQPLVFENHGIDSRYTGPHREAPTISARAGTGGNNLPLVAAADTPPLCIAGNIIDRQPQNGGNGLGCQEEIAYTLTATDRHAVFSRQRVDVFKDDEVASTQSARQHKDATDLIYQESIGALTSSDLKGPNSQYVSQDKLIVETPLLIRRLTPLECERLQGFPDGWTDLPGASDSARYKALGNSVAIPCVEYVMRGIALVLLAADMSA